MAKKTPTPIRGGPSEATREEIVKAAQTAWQAIMSGKGDGWTYWEKVCPALRLCRDDAMRFIGLDPGKDQVPQKNGRYNKEMTRNLKAMDLQSIPRTSRKAAIECSPHLKEIAAWREELRLSKDEKERQQYLDLNQPQKIWIDYKNWMGWGNKKDSKEKTFVEYKVKDALELPDNALYQNLAAILPPSRIYSIATTLLSRTEVPMRPIVADSVDALGDARPDAALALLGRLGSGTSERSVLADAIGVDRPKCNTPVPAEGSLEEIAKYISTQLSLTDKEICELAEMLLTRTGETRSRSTTTAWGNPDAVASEMAELRERARSAEAQLERRDQEQESDNADPVPKARYRETLNEVEHKWREALERVRQLETDRDQWRSRIRSEVEAQYASRVATAEEERDRAVAAQDQAIVELRAALAQIAALTSGGARDDDDVH